MEEKNSTMKKIKNKKIASIIFLITSIPFLARGIDIWFLKYFWDDSNDWGGIGTAFYGGAFLSIAIILIIVGIILKVNAVNSEKEIAVNLTP